MQTALGDIQGVSGHAHVESTHVYTSDTLMQLVCLARVLKKSFEDMGVQNLLASTDHPHACTRVSAVGHKQMHSHKFRLVIKAADEPSAFPAHSPR